MEKDCMLAHGASKVLLDRLFHQSDEFQCFVCRHCGLVAEERKPSGDVSEYSETFCRGCRLRGPENIAKVHIPCSFKVLHQELAALGVVMRMKVQPKPPTA